MESVRIELTEGNPLSRNETNQASESGPTDYSELLFCDQCQSANVSESWVIERFQYGSEHIKNPPPVQLESEVPKLCCSDCGFQWFDFRAGEIQDKQVEWWLQHRCTICKASFVDSDNGFDTCSSCLRV